MKKNKLMLLTLGLMLAIIPLTIQGVTTKSDSSDYVEIKNTSGVKITGVSGWDKSSDKKITAVLSIQLNGQDERKFHSLPGYKINYLTVDPVGNTKVKTLNKKKVAGNKFVILSLNSSGTEFEITKYKDKTIYNDIQADNDAIADQTGVKIAALTKAQIKQLTSAQIATLILAQAQAITPTQAPFFSLAQLAANCSNNISLFGNLSAAAQTASGQTQAQVNAYVPSLKTAKDISALNEMEIQALTPAQIAGLSKSVIAGFTSQQIAQFTLDQVQAFTAAQAPAFTLAQLATECSNDSQLFTNLPAAVQQATGKTQDTVNAYTPSAAAQ